MSGTASCEITINTTDTANANEKVLLQEFSRTNTIPIKISPIVLALCDRALVEANRISYTFIRSSTLFKGQRTESIHAQEAKEITPEVNVKDSAVRQDKTMNSVDMMSIDLILSD